MSSYSSLPDPVVSSQHSYFKAVVNFKFCNFGLVTSQTWTAGYLTVMDGVLRLYDSRESAERDMSNGHFLKIPLLPGHLCTPLKVNCYNNSRVNFYCFSLMYDYGFIRPLKQLKLSCLSRETAEQLQRVIKVNVS